MKTYILPNTNQYKANLHSHSTASDGRLSAAEMKEIYKARGYSIIAYTDHNVIVDHSDLNDEGFLALTGTEYNFDINEVCMDHYLKTFHINFISLDPHNEVHPCFHPKYLCWNQSKDFPNLKYDGTPDYQRDYHTVSETIKEVCSHGFIATVNHPVWSCQTYEDYKTLEGVFAMEIYNHGSYVGGLNEINDAIFDSFLRDNRKINIIAADDNHNCAPADSPYYDSFGGFVNICADELKYEKITDALIKGNYYASTGPEIKEFYLEDGVLTVKASPAARITFTTNGRHSCGACPEKGMDFVDTAKYRIHGDDLYVRVTVDDGNGHYAWTNAYFPKG